MAAVLTDATGVEETGEGWSSRLPGYDGKRHSSH
jgi:hypothetical protein